MSHKKKVDDTKIIPVTTAANVETKSQVKSGEPFVIADSLQYFEEPIQLYIRQTDSSNPLSRTFVVNISPQQRELEFDNLDAAFSYFVLYTICELEAQVSNHNGHMFVDLKSRESLGIKECPGDLMLKALEDFVSKLSEDFDKGVYGSVQPARNED